LGAAAIVGTVVSSVAFVQTRSAPAATVGPPHASGKSAGNAAPSGAGRAPSAPLPVSVLEVQPETLALSVPATGRLLAREAVDLVSELSRNLLRVRVEEGARVKRGDVLFELDARDLRAQLERLRVQTELAQVNSSRQATLASEGLASQQDAQTARAEFDALEAERKVLEVTLNKTLIRAPFDGVIGLRRVSEGAWVSPNTVLVSLHDTSRLKLDFTLPERYASLIGAGKRLKFRAEGHPGPLEAVVTAFEPAVDQSSRRVLVRAVVDNQENSLLPGTFATIELPLEAKSVLLVPNLAVIPGAEGRSLFVEKQGVARSVLVELGPRDGERVQVLRGLDAGDRVIVSNLLRVRDGMPVAARVAASAVPAAATAAEPAKGSPP
jgi:membrane fusion protein (multidrug efflux system)